ncbi:hypothetical protein PBY51_016204 [Eleginops maclovinus]|uniref:Uncharacterized protein n=1 Tax=Eleginops maclovinus TaxID=56733 RepID=A0AAN7XKA0_ELEMC|nr:hypothetical protein PBY51_016204 [Eleginops maclovinus]
MTSERSGTKERGGRGWVVVRGEEGPLGEAQRGIQSQVTFSRESSCEHSAPGRRVTVGSSVSYISYAQNLSCCLHPAQVCNNKAN